MLYQGKKTWQWTRASWIELQQGESPAYVQRQLGHASIQLTVDTYGRWLPAGNKAAVNRLDDSSSSKMVAKTVSGTPAAAEVPDSNGGPWRTRTSDPLIKRPVQDQTPLDSDSPTSQQLELWP